MFWHRHKWTRWEIFANLVDGGKDKIGIIQQRSCTDCGKIEWNKVTTSN